MKKLITDSQLMVNDGREIVCSFDFFLKIRRYLDNDEFVQFISTQSFENKFVCEYIDDWKIKNLF